MYTAALSMRTVCIHRHSALKLHHRPARPRSQCIDGPASFAVLQPLSAVAAHTAAMVVRNRGCDIASGSAVVTVQHICTCRIAKAQQRHSTTDGAADTRCCIPRDTPKYTWNSSVCVRATVNSERPHCAGEKRRVLPFLHSLTPCWLRDQQLRHGRTTA